MVNVKQANFLLGSGFSRVRKRFEIHQFGRRDSSWAFGYQNIGSRRLELQWKLQQ